jgi:hypothetical protein
VARGNEKGRVERAIRFARESFFAARHIKDKVRIVTARGLRPENERHKTIAAMIRPYDAPGDANNSVRPFADLVAAQRQLVMRTSNINTTLCYI